MIRVEKINTNILENVVSFLTSVPSIEKVDEEILQNACIAYDDEKIVGCISYEPFLDKGLIRYFVFKKILSTQYLEELLDKLEENALEYGINKLVCVAECSQIEELFNTLSFKPINSKAIFIDEDSITNTNFKNSIFLVKDIRKQ